MVCFVEPANRPLIALGGGYGYAVATLTADGEPKTISYGSGMTETIDRNSRGQVTAITAVLGTSTLLGLTNEFEASTNNGNLKSQTVAPLGIKQSYSYDNRNRLFSATEQPAGGGVVSWSQTFGYDDFGNRWVSAQSGALPGGGPRPNGAAWYQSGSPAVVNNRVAGLAYDAAGNQLTLGGMTGVYDAENRLRTTTTGDFSYDFDAFGRRVRTVAGGKTTYFVYDALGRLTAEYQVGATAGLQTRYSVQDQLGSTRLVTDGSGGVLRRSDYLPYGEEVPSGVGGRTLTGYGADGGVRQSFTGQMRDGETGLDFFGARFYSGALGRFTAVDAVGPALDVPMTLNRYQYARNNPLRFVDRNGNYEEDVHRDLTYALSLAAGYGQGSGLRIAAANQGVDDDPNTSPMGMSARGNAVGIRANYHFTSESRRSALYEVFEKSGSLEDLGVYFHAQQDSFSHAGYSPRFGHLFDGHAPDKTNTDAIKSDNMAIDTYERLIRSRSRAVTQDAGASAVPWAVIEPFVRAFNRETGLEGKRKALSSLQEAARKYRSENNTKLWLDSMRQSAIRQGGGCSAEMANCDPF